eukprot:COSAG02_NODE_25646_length_652_cov_2.794940_2_plen_56_part_01
MGGWIVVGASTESSRLFWNSWWFLYFSTASTQLPCAFGQDFTGEGFSIDDSHLHFY